MRKGRHTCLRERVVLGPRYQPANAAHPLGLLRAGGERYDEKGKSKDADDEKPHSAALHRGLLSFPCHQALRASLTVEAEPLIHMSFCPDKPILAGFLGSFAPCSVSTLAGRHDGDVISLPRPTVNTPHPAM